MELKKGYKHTDIGTIPDDWDITTVIKIADITTGDKDTQDRDDNGIYPFFVRSQVVERINSYTYDGEAVLTAGDGVGTGKVFHYINGRFDYHQRVYKVSDFKVYDGYFFFKYFSSKFLDEVSKYTAKSSVDSVRRSMIADMIIPRPPLPEQQAIGNALKDMDDLIEGIDSLLAKKRNIKQGTMQELLTGRKRLKGFSDEWKEIPFGQIFKKHPSKDYQIQSNEYLDSGKYPVVDQGKQKIIAYSDNHRKVFNCPNGGLIVFGDHTREVKFIDYDFIVGADGTQLLSTADDYSVLFLYYQLQIKYIPNTGYNRHFKYLKEMTFLVPQPVEQNAITSIIRDIDIEIELLEHQLHKYKLIKQGMTQELLTGKTRLM